MSNKIIILQDLKNQLKDFFGDDLINIYLFGISGKKYTKLQIQTMIY